MHVIGSSEAGAKGVTVHPGFYSRHCRLGPIVSG